MSARGRRAAVIAVAFVLVLLAGRWTVACLSERWWAQTLSPAAAEFVTHWRLLGLALDCAAVLGASLWFALQAMLVARAIASVQVTRRLGDLQLREAVPTRFLMLGAVGTGVLLGLITGAGARAWRAPLLLAWQGATYGTTDPVLRADLGVYTTQLPLWTVAHHFAATLVAVGLGFTALLYVTIGALRRENGEVIVHADARRQLGGLLALLAAVISVGYLLSPYHLAASATIPLDAAAAIIRVRAAQVMAGVALGVAALSILWALRGRHALVAGAWITLALGAVIERAAIPVLTGESTTAQAEERSVRRFDAIAWGLHVVERGAGADTLAPVTALWDENLLALFADRSGGALLAATPTMVTIGGKPAPAWLVATPAAGDPTRMDVLAVADGVAAATGSPRLLVTDSGLGARPVRASLPDPRIRPDAPGWRPVIGGVAASGSLRRLALAWARQAPGMLRETHERAVDWHLDPVDRAAALLPMASWLPADLLMVANRPLWVVQGVLPLDEFPVSTRAHWRGELVAGVVPAFIATMDAANGEVHCYLDPGSDSLAAAWARIAGRLVEPAAALPVELRAALPYPVAWLDAQLEVLGDPVWAIGRLPTDVAAGPDRSVVVWTSVAQAGREAVFEDPDRRAVSALITAERDNGHPQVWLDRYEPSDSHAENGAELTRIWTRSTTALHLRDSTRAAGDSVEVGPVRWFLGSGPIAAWQSVVAVPAHGPPVLLWLGTALGDRTGGGRTPVDAWASVSATPAAAHTAGGPADSAVLLQARHWMRVADSALARGDLTAFGRAIEALRSALQSPH
ncbi:MAG TPA: UPF0182 family protein [Gemmatimonadales bacterium]|nr:UPF0182 family protein [Gemmatimonadales bacterium]